MIYASALSPYLKKAKIKGTYQSTIKDIRAKLPDDPKISKMDVLAITDRDVASLQGKRLVSDITKRHKDIKIVFIYQSESNGKLITAGPGISKYKVSKIAADTVGRSISKVVSGIDVSSLDKNVYTNDSVPDIGTEEVIKEEPKKLFGFKKRAKTKAKKKSSLPIFGRTPSLDEAELGDSEEIPDDLKDVELTADEVTMDSKEISENDEDAVIIEDDIDSVPNIKADTETKEVVHTVAKTTNVNNVSNNNEATKTTTATAPVIPNDLEMPDIDVKKPKTKSNDIPSLEKRIEDTSILDGYSLIKTALTKDSINRELVAEDTEYAGCQFTLEKWDRDILDISRSNDISSNEKWDRIRELGLKRCEKKGVINNKLMNKLSKILGTITEVCKRTVTDEESKIRAGLATVVASDVANATEKELTEMFKERQGVADKLKELLMTIVETYKLMDISVDDFIKSQSDDLPSSNDFIKSNFELEKELFTPENAGILTTKILGDLKSNLLEFSSMEATLRDLIMIVFKLIDKDSDIISQQEKMYSRLKSVRVESTVTITEPLKNCLRVFVGPNNSGTTSTALSFAGMMSRRKNTLLIDIRNNNDRLSRYGETPKDLKEFMDTKVLGHMVVLKGSVKSMMDLDEILKSLGRKTDYYSSINLILDTDQAPLVNRCVEKALSINIITNSNINNVMAVKDFMKEFKPENVGCRIVTIDPAVERMEFLKKIGVDEFIYQVIPIPYLKDMRSCAIRQEAPYNRESISTCFEEVFR